MVVCAGVTESYSESFTSMIPKLWSMEALVAFPVVHERSDDSPAEMDVGEAFKEQVGGDVLTTGVVVAGAVLV